MTTTQITAQMKEWTTYGMIEGEQDWQTSFDEAREYLELTEEQVSFLTNDAFVKECFETVERFLEENM